MAQEIDAESQTAAGAETPNRLISRPPLSSLDELLSKYVRVWVWSILLGATSGLSYAFLGIGHGLPWGSLNFLPLVVLCLGALAIMGGWFELANYLVYGILPEFFGLDRHESYGGDQKYSDWKHRRAAVSIRRSFQFLLIGALAMLLLHLSSAALEGLGRVGGVF